jgi:hypothetical protein
MLQRRSSTFIPRKLTRLARSSAAQNEALATRSQFLLRLGSIVSIVRPKKIGVPRVSRT